MQHVSTTNASLQVTSALAGVFASCTAYMQASLSVAVGQRAPNRAGYTGDTAQRTTQRSDSAAATGSLRTTHPASPQLDAPAEHAERRHDSAAPSGRPRSRERERDHRCAEPSERSDWRDSRTDARRRTPPPEHHRRADTRRPLSRERDADRARDARPDDRRANAGRHGDRPTDRYGGPLPHRPDPRGEWSRDNGGYRGGHHRGPGGGGAASRVFGRSADDVFSKKPAAAESKPLTDDVDLDPEPEPAGAVFIGRRRR